MKISFLNNIRRGLGTAYLELNEAKNKMDYYDTLVFACLHDSSYECFVEGPKGYYLYTLISLFDIGTKEGIKKQIIDSLNINDKKDLLFQKLDLIYSYYNDGDESIKTVVYDFYHLFVKETRIWTKNKLLSFEILCIYMDRLFGLKESKNIIKDIIYLNMDKDYLGWFICKLESKYKKSKLIQDFCKENDEQIKKKDSRKKDHSLEELIINYTDRVYIALFSLKLSEEEFIKVCEYLKTPYDNAVAKAILKSFQSKGVKYQLPEEVLFNLIGYYDETFDDEIYCTLSYYTSLRVELLGLSLIENKKYMIHGLKMLMMNYKAQYKDLIIRAYKKVHFGFYNNLSRKLTHRTIDFMNNKKSNYPDEILAINYRKSYSSFLREQIFDCMKKRGLINKTLLNEIEYDFNDDLYAKAKRLLSKTEISI